MRCVRLIPYRIYIRRLKKYSIIAALTGFVLMASFAVLNTTYQTVRGKIDDYKKQTTVLNPEVDMMQKYDVILSAYMNSGSTYSGQILGFRPDTFYVYEPLWHLTVWEYYRDNFTVCSSRTTGCRQISMTEANKNMPIVGPGRHMDLKVLHDPDITDESAPLTIPQRILGHVFKCRLPQLANIIQPGVTPELKFAGPSWSTFNLCISMNKKIESCLAELSNVCNSASHRMVKVLRISVHALEPLLKDNPKLKVVHLFRDPRAIIHSRIETDGYPLRFSLRGSPEIRKNAEALCTKMAADLEEGKRLMQRYPEQFRFIHYEDIYSNITSLIKLHTMLGMKVTQGGLDNGRRIGHVNNPRRYTGDRRRHRRRNNAYWWTQYMKWGIIQTVDAVCHDVCRSLGYPLLGNKFDLQELDLNTSLSKLVYKL